jgi:hypothetical protein
MRSDFVHNAKFPPLSEKGVDSTYGTIGGKPAVVEITAEDLERISEKAIKTYFENNANF